jgi:hypothetical protein
LVPLNNTGDTVIMLLVAAGVGLLGGIGAGLLEIRRDPEKAKDSAGTIFSSIVLGGIAAVAILYFFPPEETISTTVDGMTEVVKEYNLTKLVALALIVGSAGASFLLVLQKRTMDLADAKDEAAKKAGDTQATRAKASEALIGVGNQVPTLARNGVEGAAPAIKKVLEEAKEAEPGPIDPAKLQTIVKEIANQAETAAEESIGGVVEDAQKRVLSSSVVTDPATATGQEGTGNPTPAVQSP